MSAYPVSSMMGHRLSKTCLGLKIPADCYRMMTQCHNKLYEELHSGKKKTKAVKMDLKTIQAISQTLKSSIIPSDLLASLNWFLLLYCILTGPFELTIPRLSSSNVTIGV